MDYRGDFNEILVAGEKKGGKERSQRQMDLFRSTIDSCSLLDVDPPKDIYTWSRKCRDGTFIQERLDCFLINHSLKDKFRDIKVSLLSRHTSDHKPFLAQLLTVDVGGHRSNKSVQRSVQFEESWAAFKDCKAIVEDHWKEENNTDASGFNRKVEGCLRRLKKWYVARLNGSIKGTIVRKEVEIKRYLEWMMAMLIIDCLKLKMSWKICWKKKKCIGNSSLVKIGLDGGTRTLNGSTLKLITGRKRTRLMGSMVSPGSDFIRQRILVGWRPIISKQYSNL